MAEMHNFEFVWRCKVCGFEVLALAPEGHRATHHAVIALERRRAETAPPCGFVCVHGYGPCALPKGHSKYIWHKRADGYTFENCE